MPVTIAYNPAGLAPPTGTLNLSRRSLCGIFSGHINNWNDPSITGDHGVAVSPGQQITVVHPADSSGTTFLLTNALVAQCKDVVGTDAATGNAVSYAFPWTDRAFTYAEPERFFNPTNTVVEYTKTGQCNPQGRGPYTGGPGPYTSSGLPIHGARLINWPQLPAMFNVLANSDQCGVPVTAPTNSVFAQPATNGDVGVQALIQATTGAVGYLPPDFTWLFCSICGLPLTASLQNQFLVDNPDTTTLIKNFVERLMVIAARSMSGASAGFSTSPNAIFNPLNWSSQGVVANPLGVGDYPIVGFSWLNFYQCYSPAKFPAILSLLAWYYGKSAVNGNYGVFEGFLLDRRGFAPIPANWQAAVIDAILGVDPFNGASTGFGLNGSSCSAFE